MKKITVTNEVTMADVAQRIQYFVERANKIHDLISKDKAQAKREYTDLYKEQDKEYHELTLVKNQQLLENSGALRAYRGYFSHLHFIENVYDNLSWNLREFSQGNMWFETRGKFIED